MAKQAQLWALVALFLSGLACTNGAWDVGVGIADVTGPAGGIGMMGFAKPGQNTAGIHTRLHSRAFVFDDGVSRGVFVSIDMGMMGQLVKRFVIDALQAEFGDVYRFDNVILSGTHTHSGPAGYLQYVLFDVTCLGFIDDSFQALVQGITESIRRAHNNMQPSYLYYSEGELHDANINRSPTSYLANPEEERARYEYDTDHVFAQLNIFSRETNMPLGLINWFAVHPNTMNNSNHLISSDNKGSASLIVEKMMNPGQLMGKGPFVAAFAATNLGDTSPNLNGPKCIDTGLECDTIHSTCDGRNEMCIADGPGENIFESTWIIGERQANKAVELLNDMAGYQELQGNLQLIHQWINMTNYPVTLDDGSEATTCPAAMGYSFAAGCTDGPGAFDFIQGSNDSNPFWDLVSGILQEPSPEQEACHMPKPILLDTGEITWPYKWHPDVVDTQMMKIGDLIISAMPGEFTTMAGRRLRQTVLDAALANGASPVTRVVLAGLCNVYTHYITTFEEYQRQRYEAASVIFGPHTLRAYQQQYAYLTANMLQGNAIASGPEPPNLYDDQISLVPDVPVDVAPAGTAFGDCVLQPLDSIAAGGIVVVSFVSGHPRNNPMLEGSFMTVEQETSPGVWTIVYTDADWETRFYWFHGENEGESESEMHWEIPATQAAGTYRIRHMGYHKNADGVIEYYEGACNAFQVV